MKALTIKISWLAIIGLVLALMFFGLVGFANAAVLTYNADTNVYLSTPGYTVTIKLGSVATSVVVGGSSFRVVVPTSSTFTVASRQNMDLTLEAGTGSYSNTCSGTTNTTVITSTAAADYTITPNGGVCASASGGGGGGGGILDTTAPTGTSVSISAGASSTVSTSVALTLSATDSGTPIQMMLSNDSVFTGAVWETYATSKTWTLTSGDGTKTVYAKFKDVSGNTSTAVSDAITLATT